MADFVRVLRTGLSSLRDRAAARLAALRFNPSRCWLGHDWKLSKGVGYSFGDGPMVILFDKDCRRCGKHQDGGMVV